MRVEYFISSGLENPVKDFLNSLTKKQKAKIFRIIQNIEVYGLNSVIPHLKKLSGTPFWEITIFASYTLCQPRLQFYFSTVFKRRLKEQAQEICQ